MRGFNAVGAKRAESVTEKLFHTGDPEPGSVCLDVPKSEDDDAELCTLSADGALKNPASRAFPKASAPVLPFSSTEASASPAADSS